MDSIQIGTLISRLRREQGLTQKELASLLGVSDKAVSKWERGECFPDITLIPPLAAQLGVTTDELLAGRQNQPPEEPLEPEQVRQPQASMVPLLMDEARSRLRRWTYGAYLLVMLGFLLRYALSNNSLTGGSGLTSLAAGLSALCAMGGAALFLLAASRCQSQVRHYGALAGGSVQEELYAPGLLIGLTVVTLFVSLCLDLSWGTAAINWKAESLYVIKGSFDLAIPALCGLAVVNLALRWWGDRRRERPDGWETLVTALSVLVALCAVTAMTALQLQAVKNGTYGMPAVPETVLASTREDLVSGGILSGSWRAALRYQVPGLQYAVAGTLPLAVVCILLPAVLNGIWFFRRRTRRSLVCGLANVAVCALLLAGTQLWFRLAPLGREWVGTMVALLDEETMEYFVFLVSAGLFDCVAVGALTLRHLAGVLTARPRSVTESQE